MPKKILRSEALAKRDALAPEVAAAMSAGAQALFLALPEFGRARSVALYAAIRNEVDTASVAGEVLRLGKTLLYPATVDQNLDFREVRSLSDLLPGKYRIPEPQGPSRDPARIDLVLVPGVCFDLSGRRIGYGKGYYDRALHRLEGKGMLVGLCYEFQLLEEIVGEPHDVVMDIIVTEERVVRVRKNIDQGV